MQNARSCSTEQWFCPRCMRWYSIDEECECPTHEPSGLRRSRERGSYSTNGRNTKPARGRRVASEK